MYVIEVIPLSVLPPNVPQVLSYYHDIELQKGVAVEVLVHTRKVQAIVIGSTEIGEQKILLKKSLFQLKKISSVIHSEPHVSDFQFKIALWLAHEYVAPLGATLKHVLPPFFLKKKYPTPLVSTKKPLPSPQPIVVLSRAKDSYRELLSYTKNSKGQALLVVPEMSYIPFFQQKFEGSLVLHSGISNKDFYAVWQHASTMNSQIFIGTRQALFLPFSNLSTLIVVDPLHEFYKSDSSPKYRTPDLARMVSELYGAQLLYSSNLLGINNHHETTRDHIKLVNRQRAWPARLEIIDMVAEQKRGYVGLLASDIKENIREAVEEKRKVLIFAARRGYSGILVCQNCGFTFKCPKCMTPMRTHQSAELLLMCHRDNTTLPYPRFCANCHSSSIKPTGPAGSQKIYEELRRMMDFGQIPRVPALILDTDVTQNQTEEDEIMQELKKDGPAILIATQKIFSYIYDYSFDYIVIPQFDALVTSADFQTNERLWYQMEKLVDFDPELISIQTYQKENPIPIIAQHTYETLYRDELQMREMFTYPPFSKIIKLTFGHTYLTKAGQEGRMAVEKLKRAAIHLQIQDHVQISETSPLFIRKESGQFVYTIILKILPGLASLRELLRYVPSHWLIDVDPRSML